MDIDIKTFLLVLIIIVGVIFVLLISNYSLFDSNNVEETSASNTVETALAQNVTKKPSKTNSNTENKKKNPIDSMMSVTTEEETENVEDVAEETPASNTNLLQKPLTDSLIEKNNPSPSLIFQDSERYLTRTVKYSYLKPTCTLNYKVPESWADKRMHSDKDPITGAYIRTHASPLSDFGEYSDESTYEEFLNDFIEHEKRNELQPENIEFSYRTLLLDNGTEYPIIVKDEYYGISNFMVFVYKGNVLALEITADSKDYTDEYIRRIDNIFASTYVYY